MSDRLRARVERIRRELHLRAGRGEAMSATEAMIVRLDILAPGAGKLETVKVARADLALFADVAAQALEDAATASLAEEEQQVAPAVHPAARPRVH